MEKDNIESKPVPSGSSDHAYGESETVKPNFFQRVFDSFKRDPNAHVTTTAASGRSFDAENAAANTASSALHRKLKARHMQMIAIGGSIGEGIHALE